MPEIFLDEDIHPMTAALNILDYDIWVTGNHDYNYGIDILKCRSTIYTENDRRAIKIYEDFGSAVL